MPKLVQRGKAELDIPQASGVVWDAARDRLLVVSDERSDIYIVDPDATRITGTIELRGGPGDREGIAVRGDDLLVVAERSRQIVRYDLDGELREVVDVPIRGPKNSGLEGITVDAATGHVYVVHENRPRMLVELDRDLKICGIDDLDNLDDLSGLCIHDGALWVVSDESKRLARYRLEDEGLQPDGRWKIGRAYAEGLAFVGSRVFVVFDKKGTNLRWYDAP